jgi:hypothetical protein
MRQTDSQGRVLMVHYTDLRRADCCERTLWINGAWVTPETVDSALLTGFVPVQKIDEVHGGENGECFCNLHFEPVKV